MHGDYHALIGQVKHAFWRLICNEGDGGCGWVLVPVAGDVCEMVEYKPIEDTSPVDGLERCNIIAVIVISGSRREWEEVFTHVDNCQKM